MGIVLIGLVAVGYGLFKMYTDQNTFDKHTLNYIQSIEDTLNSLKDKDD